MPVTGRYIEVLISEIIPAGGGALVNPLNRIPSHIHIEQLSGDGVVTIDRTTVTIFAIPVQNPSALDAECTFIVRFWHSHMR